MIQQFNHHDPIISNVGTFYLLWQWPLYTLRSLASQRYRPGDRVDVNCTSELSKPAADLVWDGILLARFLSNERKRWNKIQNEQFCFQEVAPSFPI